jgi:hypothetical protein
MPLYCHLSARTAANLGVSIVLAAVVSSGSSAQSDSDLRKQNQQLSSRVQELEQELIAAVERNRVLEERISQLQAQLAAAVRGGPGAVSAQPPLEPEEVTVDETIPNASPRALHNALIASYEQTFAEFDKGRPGDGKRRAFMKSLEGWKSRVDREFRSPIVWYVEVVGSRAERGDRIVTLTPVDPKTRVRLGRQFDISLSKLMADRLAAAESRGEADLLVLRGILIPNVHINEARETRGAFNNPPFIGPFAELYFSVEPRSLLPVREDAGEHAKSAAPGAKPAATLPAGDPDANK